MRTAVLDVDEDRARRHDVDRCRADGLQLVRGGADEAAPIEGTTLACRSSAEGEQVLRDVVEDDLVRSPVECSEGHEPFSAADVEDRLARDGLSREEDAIAPAPVRVVGVLAVPVACGRPIPPSSLSARSRK